MADAICSNMCRGVAVNGTSSILPLTNEKKGKKKKKKERKKEGKRKNGQRRKIHQAIPLGDDILSFFPFLFSFFFLFSFYFYYLGAKDDVEENGAPAEEGGKGAEQGHGPRAQGGRVPQEPVVRGHVVGRQQRGKGRQHAKRGIPRTQSEEKRERKERRKEGRKEGESGPCRNCVGRHMKPKNKQTKRHKMKK
jgi:hypothetical protein